MPHSPEGPLHRFVPSSADSGPPDMLDEATITNIREAVALRERLAARQHLLWHDKSDAERSPSQLEVREYIRDAEREWYDMVKSLLGVDEETLWKITKGILDGNH